MSSLLTYLLVLYIVVAEVYGLYLLHKTHKRTRKARAKDAERDKGHEAIVFHGYQGYKLPLSYLLCIVLGPIKLLFIPTLAFSILVSRILIIGADLNKELAPWRRTLVRISLWCVSNFVVYFTLFIFPSEEVIDADYSEFLGPKWREELKAHKKVIPTIVSNHTSFLDMVMFLQSRFVPSFSGRASDKTSMVGPQGIAMETLWIDRDNTKEQNNQLVEQLADRQRQIEAGKYKPISIFPEGLTTNGSVMCKFKRGAFHSLLPVQPMLFYYQGFPFDPVMSCLDVTSFTVYLMFGTFWSTHRRQVLPPFIPNDYMFEKFKDKGTEKSHIYAWVVREAMSKASGIPTNDDIDLLSKGEYCHKVGLMTKKNLDKLRKKKTE